MPDKRKHRGPHPDDGALFHPDRQPALARAVRHLSWLSSRDYAAPSALKLVGDRFQLTRRQRIGVRRCACADAALAARLGKRLGREGLAGEPLFLDGYNVLTTVEAAYAGGIILAGRDGCYRDMASMHGSYRRVEETWPAIRAAGTLLEAASVTSCCWFLDRPVSNSGRLKVLLLEAAAKNGWSWTVELVADPDPILSDIEGVVATADSVILDRCRRWFNLAREVIDTAVPGAVIADLG